MSIYFLFPLAYFAAIIFVIVLLWRFVVAHEKIARHLLELSRDFKRHTTRDRD